MSTPSSSSRTGSSPTPRSDWSSGSTRSGCGADAGEVVGPARSHPHCSPCPPLADFVASNDSVATSRAHHICYPGGDAEIVGSPWHGRAVIHNRQLRGVELRYALTMYLFQHGPQTVADLIDALEFQSFRHSRTSVESSVGRLTERDPPMAGCSGSNAAVTALVRCPAPRSTGSTSAFSRSVRKRL